MPKIICTRCRKDVVKDLEYPAWLSLMNFLSFLYNEEQITKRTYEDMQNDLMIIRPPRTYDDEEE